MTTRSGYDAVITALLSRDLLNIKPGTRQMARCPAHEDKRESLAVAQGDNGVALIHCFANCPTPEVVKALGLSMRELFGDRPEVDAAQYIYRDIDGSPLIRVTRTWPKGFRQGAWDPERNCWLNRLGNVKRVPYDLPEWHNSESVWLVEGEKDVETLKTEGVPATTLMGGAGKWRDEYAEYFRGKRVFVVQDKDDPGREGAARIRTELRGVAERCLVFEAPDGYKDVTDLYNDGHGVGDLVRYEPAADVFQPVDWEQFEPEEVEWLLEKYVPVNRRVIAYGKSGSLKSLWAMWLASQLAKAGHKVAYFNVEMPMAEAVNRLHKMQPPKDNFKLFRKLSFESQSDLSAACDLLQGYSLIVVDSWSAVHGETNNNDAVARLDREFFLPLIEETGATLLILDNTGKDVMGERGPIQQEEARGASAKKDKMDMALLFERPDEMDNHTTRIRVKKLRGDGHIPKPLLVRTDKDDIDFRVIDRHGTDLGSMWEGVAPPPELQEGPAPDERPMSVLEKLAEAKAAKRRELDEARLEEVQL